MSAQEPVILESLLQQVKVFTTRVDTLYSSAFLVLAPEHALVPILTTKQNKKKVEAYIEKARKETDIERTVW